MIDITESVGAETYTHDAPRQELNKKLVDHFSYVDERNAHNTRSPRFNKRGNHIERSRKHKTHKT
jgi:hypothetical protein